MNSTDFRRVGYEAIDKIADYYDRIQDNPIQSEVKPGDLRRMLPVSAPEYGEPWSQISADMKRVIEPGLSHWAHPGFMAYFPASSTFEGILGELYSAAYNGPAFDWVCSPSVTELENVVMDWLVQLLQLPKDFLSSSASRGGGIIMDSTTESLIATMVAARDRFLQNTTKRLQQLHVQISRTDLMRRLVVIGSSETHMSTKKAASIIGVEYRAIECRPGTGIAWTESQIRDLIDQCLDEGLMPFYLTATFGTTNSCAVDDFPGIAKIGREFPDIWVHVDAAFAGAALVCEEYHELLGSEKSFDSISVNLGKWLLTNLDSTALLVRNQTYLVDALQNSCSILANEASESGRVIDYRNWQLSMGRRFRALKVWFVLRSWGKIGIQAHIRRHIKMAEKFTCWLKAKPDLFRLVAKPQFALNVFTVSQAVAEQSGLSVEQMIDSVVQRVNGTNEVWLSKVAISSHSAIRVVSANPKANLATLERAFALLVYSTEAVLLESKRAACSQEGIVQALGHDAE